MKENHISLRLYVAGDSPNSRQAIANLESLCQEQLPGRHTIEIVDVFVSPEQAMADGVFLTPMLLVLSHDPPRSIVGTLSDRGVVLGMLGLGAGAA
jgi:circadian clock protein KaiB